jgi:hypothetical protein
VEEAEGVEAKGLDAGAGVTAGVEEVGAAIGAGAGNPQASEHRHQRSLPWIALLVRGQRYSRFYKIIIYSLRFLI